MLCTYSPTRPLKERIEAFVWNTGRYFVVASLVNELFLCLIEVEDLFPGILVGAAAALAQNLTHAVVHIETYHHKDFKKEGCRLPYAIELWIGMFLTYQLSKGLLKMFDYSAGRGAIVRLGALAMISIALYNQVQKS
jgi:hypothetical protein